MSSSTKMEHEHSAEAIKERLALGPQHNYLRDWIYGGIDGSVTTFAVVSGVRCSFTMGCGTQHVQCVSCLRDNPTSSVLFFSPACVHPFVDNDRGSFLCDRIT